MSLQQWVNSQANPEVVVNENFSILAGLAVYGRDPTTTTGLTWGFEGGRWSGFAISAGTVSLTASATNYLTVARATGVLSVSTSITNWNNQTDHARAYLIVAGATTVTSFEDHRVGASGVFGSAPPANISIQPVNNQTGTTYTLALSDAGGVVRANNVAAQTITIPPNASVPFPVGTVLGVRQIGAGAVTVSPGAGVTLNAPAGFLARTAYRGADLRLHEVAENLWDVFGDLAVAPPGDPLFSNVQLLLHFDGTNGQTTTTDVTGKTVTLSSTFALTTAQQRFGTSSVQNSATNVAGIIVEPVAALQPSSSAVTIEGWFRLTSTSQQSCAFRFNVFNDTLPVHVLSFIVIDATRVAFEYGTAASGLVNYSFPLNTWVHLAMTRDGNSIRVFANGTQIGPTLTFSGAIKTLDRFSIGFVSNNGSSFTPWVGQIDEFRYTVGAARYTANFTPPSAPFPDA